jgi:hypothetical protein
MSNAGESTTFVTLAVHFLTCYILLCITPMYFFGRSTAADMADPCRTVDLAFSMHGCTVGVHIRCGSRIRALSTEHERHMMIVLVGGNS